MFAQGAKMAIIPVGEQVMALAVYRIHLTTFHGLRLYVDDLVTDERERGQGFGAALMKWCMERARLEDCDTFALDSGVQRAGAHRFYFRQGMEITSFGFTKELR